MIPSTDQDVDDVSLGELLTEAHRGQADYCEPEGVSVSQSSSVMFDGSGQPDGERMVDQSGKPGVTFNMISAHSNFSEDIQTEKMVDRSLQPDERNSSNAQIRTLLEEQRQAIIAQIFVCVVTRSTNAEVQHNDMMMWTNVQMTRDMRWHLRYESSVFMRSQNNYEQLRETENKACTCIDLYS